MKIKVKGASPEVKEAVEKISLLNKEQVEKLVTYLKKFKTDKE